MYECKREGENQRIRVVRVLFTRTSLALRNKPPLLIYKSFCIFSEEEDEELERKGRSNLTLISIPPNPHPRLKDSNLVDPASIICLSQRLSHACLSISYYTVKLRMAHYISKNLFDSNSTYLDNCWNPRANTC